MKFILMFIILLLLLDRLGLWMEEQGWVNWRRKRSPPKPPYRPPPYRDVSEPLQERDAQL